MPMIDASPTERLFAKEILLAYIAALGSSAEHLFRKESHQAGMNKGFEDVWETILKTVSDRS